jgi:hypothetical protein
LRRVFHPDARQRARESAALRRNLESLWRALGRDLDVEENSEQDSGAGALADVEAEDRPFDPAREIVELLGLALWDVFSDNNEVGDSAGITCDLGSFRGSAGYLAEAINHRYAALQCSYSYLDFYMGTILVSGRADLTPVYRWIFRRLHDRQCRWRYAFPRLYFTRFQKETEGDLTGYDPSDAVQLQLEAAARDADDEALSQALDREYMESIRRARHAPLPAIVAAYRDVFGELPDGWPHAGM